MDIQRFYTLIKEDANFEESDTPLLKELAYEYPYFQAAIFSYLKALYADDLSIFEKELHHFAVFIGDRKALFYHIFSEEYSNFLAKSGKAEIKEDKTSILLNAFFESQEIDEGNNLGLEYSLSNSSLATTDYFSYINSLSFQVDKKPKTDQEDHKDLKHQNIIDSFIHKSESEGGIQFKVSEESLSKATTSPLLDSDEELEEDMFFTETLAKIYIKQKKYEKAHKIIKHLSLNYPKKNIYFADQLSFLEKLIINSKFKDTK